MTTQSRALSARPDLHVPGLRVEVNVEGKDYGTGTVTDIKQYGVSTFVSVQLDGEASPRTFNPRWVWANQENFK